MATQANIKKLKAAISDALESIFSNLTQPRNYSTLVRNMLNDDAISAMLQAGKVVQGDVVIQFGVVIFEAAEKYVMDWEKMQVRKK